MMGEKCGVIKSLAAKIRANIFFHQVHGDHVFFLFFVFLLRGGGGHFFVKVCASDYSCFVFQDDVQVGTAVVY